MILIICDLNRNERYYNGRKLQKTVKLLIDKDMKKSDLEREAGISHYTVYKLSHGENVTTEILEKICKALNCSVEEIMEFTNDE